jgi:hypothetical protein
LKFSSHRIETADNLKRHKKKKKKTKRVFSSLDFFCRRHEKKIMSHGLDIHVALLSNVCRINTQIDFLPAPLTDLRLRCRARANGSSRIIIIGAEKDIERVKRTTREL